MDTEPPLASAAANPQSAPSHNSTSNTGGNNTVIVNPSSRNMSSIDSDAEYARQLQEEEFQQAAQMRNSGRDMSSLVRQASGSNADEEHAGGVGGPRRPLLERGFLASAAGGQQAHREVRGHAISEASQVSENSKIIFYFYVLFGIAELTACLTVLSIGWNRGSCDVPLGIVSLLYTARWVFLLPIAIMRYRNRHVRYSEERPDHLLYIRSWVQFASFVIMIVLQYYFFSSKTCADTNTYFYKLALALIVLFYIGLFLPLVILFLLCLCLPFALIFLRVFAPNQGAKPEAIKAIPKRRWQPPEGGIPAGENAPSCSICMEDYKPGDELRSLPCHHEMHVQCVDRWLAINSTCPNCRHPINEPAGAADGANAQQGSNGNARAPHRSSEADNQV